MGQVSTSALRDLVGNSPLNQAANAAMAVADGVQKIEHKGARLIGLACAFLLAAEEAGIQINDMIGMAKNCMNTAEGRKPEFNAVSQYIHHEIFN